MFYDARALKVHRKINLRSPTRFFANSKALRSTHYSVFRFYIPRRGQPSPM
jgi:hypothetical protein